MNRKEGNRFQQTGRAIAEKGGRGGAIEPRMQRPEDGRNGMGSGQRFPDNASFPFVGRRYVQERCQGRAGVVKIDRPGEVMTFVDTRPGGK